MRSLLPLCLGCLVLVLVVFADYFYRANQEITAVQYQALANFIQNKASSSERDMIDEVFADEVVTSTEHLRLLRKILEAHGAYSSVVDPTGMTIPSREESKLELAEVLAKS